MSESFKRLARNIKSKTKEINEPRLQYYQLINKITPKGIITHLSGILTYGVHSLK